MAGVLIPDAVVAGGGIVDRVWHHGYASSVMESNETFRLFVQPG
jgi:hypothetical protein